MRHWDRIWQTWNVSSWILGDGWLLIQMNKWQCTRPYNNTYIISWLRHNALYITLNCQCRCESIKATYKSHGDGQRHSDTQLPQVSFPVSAQDHVKISKMVCRYHGNEAGQPAFPYLNRHRNIMQMLSGIKAKLAKGWSRNEWPRSGSNVDRSNMTIKLEVKVRWRHGCWKTKVWMVSIDFIIQCQTIQTHVIDDPDGNNYVDEQPSFLHSRPKLHLYLWLKRLLVTFPWRHSKRPTPAQLENCCCALGQQVGCSTGW